MLPSLEWCSSTVGTSQGSNEHLALSPTRNKKAVRKKAPNISFLQVEEKQFEHTSLNFLEKQTLYKYLPKASIALDNALHDEARVIRERLFQKTTSRQKWPKRLVPGSAVDRRDNENKATY